MSNTTKTPKGTVLPLMNLKGKPYLQVAHRLIWFREEEPQSGIETKALVLTEDYAVFQATITRDGKVVAMATKRETKKDFGDFVEKSETGSIGRALALLGYGTQFTLPDLDEGERLADSPIMPGIKADSPVAEKQTPAQAPAQQAESAPSKPAAKKMPFNKPGSNKTTESNEGSWG
jgi:hypothetical protein